LRSALDFFFFSWLFCPSPFIVALHLSPIQISI
jgi:hypothetical protein